MRFPGLLKCTLLAGGSGGGGGGMHFPGLPKRMSLVGGERQLFTFSSPFQMLLAGGRGGGGNAFSALSNRIWLESSGAFLQI